MPVYVYTHHTQWAVGQGFFRTGEVTVGNVQVDYAYDCGSLNRAAREREIRTVAAGREKPFDVVYLSHFHDDHVNGVPQLVRDAGVRRFVIPLVPPAERLLAFAASSGPPGDPDPGAPGWYEGFIVDPVGALTALGEGVDVIQVEPGGADLPGGAVPEVPDGDFAASFTPPASASQGAAMVTIDVATAPQGPLWIWAPYVLQRARSGQGAFLDALATELGRDRGLLATQLDEEAVVHDLVVNQRDALIRAYALVAKNLNLTSLCLYSGLAPASVSVASHWRSRRGGVSRPEVAAWDLQPGWLGTGDAPLGTQASAKEISDHYRSVLAGVGALALPHHGSRYDFHQDLLAMFGPAQPTCFVGADVGNQYKHPHTEVVQAVADHGSHLVAVTGSETSRWRSSATTRV